MKYEDFIRVASKLPVFGLDFLNIYGLAKGYGKLLLHRWESTGKLVRLKRGLYALPPTAQPAFSTLWLANYLYSPSYVTSYFMLSFYDLIPEAVTVVTSLSTRKTARFTNAYGVFDYRSVKLDCFFGFETVPDELGRLVQRATPEKALLDVVYFDPDFEAAPDYFESGMRLQQTRILRKKVIKDYAKLYGSKKMLAAAEILVKIL